MRERQTRTDFTNHFFADIIEFVERERDDMRNLLRVLRADLQENPHVLRRNQSSRVLHIFVNFDLFLTFVIYSIGLRFVLGNRVESFSAIEYLVNDPSLLTTRLQRRLNKGCIIGGPGSTREVDIVVLCEAVYNF